LKLHFYLNVGSFLFSLLFQWQLLSIFSGLETMKFEFSEAPRALYMTLTESKTEELISACSFMNNSFDEPVVEESVIEEPVIEESVIDEPVIEESVIEEPVVEESVIDEPVIEESVIEEPVIEESVIDEPVVEESVIEEPVVEESVIDEPVIEESVIEEPVVEESVVDEPVVEESVIDEPVVEESVIEEPEEEVLQSEYLSEPDWLKNLQRLVRDTSDKTNLQTPEKTPALSVRSEQQKELKQKGESKQQLENIRTPETDRVDSGGSGGTDEGFINLLRRRVLHCRRYPDAASRNRRAGVVELELQINRDGVIKNTQIVKGSGSIILDEAALSISACIGKLPSIAEEIRVSMPVHYQMRYTGRESGR
jgi:TonB family protein